MRPYGLHRRREEALEMIREGWGAGRKVGAIAADLGVTPSLVSYYARQLGLPKRKGRGRPRQKRRRPLRLRRETLALLAIHDRDGDPLQPPPYFAASRALAFS